MGSKEWKPLKNKYTCLNFAPFIHAIYQWTECFVYVLWISINFQANPKLKISQVYMKIECFPSSPTGWLFFHSTKLLHSMTRQRSINTDRIYWSKSVSHTPCLIDFASRANLCDSQYIVTMVYFKQWTLCFRWFNILLELLLSQPFYFDETHNCEEWERIFPGKMSV